MLAGKRPSGEKNGEAKTGEAKTQREKDRRRKDRSPYPQLNVMDGGDSCIACYI